jgi:ABC-type bacteriocin/lantibiotic exporter with double-glycine peptidase domain
VARVPRPVKPGPRSLAAGLALAALLAAACAPVALAPATPSKDVVSLKLPFVAQAGPHLCGVACVEMLTLCYGRPLGAAAMRSLKAEAQSTGGVSGASLKAALEGAGYEVAVFPGTLDRGQAGLFRQVDKGLPVLVMTGSAPRHYDLVAGYDEGLARISLMDPAAGRVSLPFAEFDRRWEQAGRFALLAAPAPD